MTVETCRYRTREIAFSVVQTEIESVRKQDIIKTGVRVYEDNLIGVAGTMGPLDEDGRADIEEKARGKLSLGIEYPFEPSANCFRTMDMTREIVPRKNLFEEITGLLADLRQRQPGFSFSYRISQAWIEHDLANDRGLDLHYRDHVMMVGLTYKEKTSANIIDGSIGYCSRRYRREDYLSMVERICRAFSERLDPLPEGRYPVVFTGDFPLLYDKFATDLQGRTFATGGSLFSGKRGQKLFSDRFTLDQCHDPLRRINSFFDSEGVVNDGLAYTLIDRGVLVCPYTDKRIAHSYGLPHTGSSASHYDEVPGLACYPLMAASSGQTLKELLGGQTGIYVHVADGGNYTPDGDFATPVQVAFLFDGERLLGRLPECRISGNIFDLFGGGYRGKSRDRLFPLSDDHELVLEMTVSGM